MKRFYLDEINANFWRNTNKYIPKKRAKERAAKWKEERKKYGFDNRDTWNVDVTMVALLYERLRMYVDTAPVDLTLHKFQWDEEEINQEEFLSRLIQLCEDFLKDDDVDYDHNYVSNIWHKWAIVSLYTWW